MSEKQVSQSRQIKVTVSDKCDHKKHSQHSVQKNIQAASKYTYFCTIKTETEMQVLDRHPISAPQKWRQQYQPKCRYLQGCNQEFWLGGGGCSTNSVEDRGQTEWGSGGGSPLVRGSGGSCILVQEISFHIVKFS